jgi:hypothetical protein
MRYFRAIVLGTVLALLLVGAMGAADTKSHSVQMQVLEICVLRVTAAPSALVISAPTQGGENSPDATENSTYLQYTSTVAASKSRKITAAWGASDAAPAGCALKLTATPSGGTNQGSSAGQITMSNAAADIVTTIKSCATGIGASNGARLAYVLTVTDPTLLVAAESKTTTVTFTLTDAS